MMANKVFDSFRFPPFPSLFPFFQLLCFETKKPFMSCHDENTKQSGFYIGRCILYTGRPQSSLSITLFLSGAEISVENYVGHTTTFSH